MNQAINLINQASEIAGVKASSQSLPLARSREYLELLNMMIAQWRDDGVGIGVNTLELTDTVYVHESDKLAIVYNLATLIFEKVGRNPSVAVYKRANDLFKVLERKYLNDTELEISAGLRQSRRYDINQG